MDRELPFCPLCQDSLLQVDCVKLVCNHCFCHVCVLKMQTDTGYVCYFDGIASKSFIDLTGLKQQLIGVLSVTNPGLIGAAIENHGIRYEKLNIPCKFTDCSPRCPYDHSGRFYRKTECAFGMSCPNSKKCIFKHTASLPGTDSQVPTPPEFNSYQMMSTVYCAQCGQIASESYCAYCNTALETCGYCGQAGNFANFRMCQYCQAWRMYCQVCQVWGQYGRSDCSYCQQPLS